MNRDSMLLQLLETVKFWELTDFNSCQLNVAISHLFHLFNNLLPA